MFDRDDRPLVRPRVKICGITNGEDARAAIEFGADALGFNFFSGSKRYLPVTAAEWIAELPAEIVKVAVLVNASWDEAVAAGRHCHSSTLFSCTAWKRLSFAKDWRRKGFSLPKPSRSGQRVLYLAPPAFFTRTLILDSSEAGEFGGSGRTFPWEMARDFIQANPSLRVILAGGLTPENVARAVDFVRPFGVDVTTGVESSPGRKDHGLLRAFIAAARGL